MGKPVKVWTWEDYDGTRITEYEQDSPPHYLIPCADFEELVSTACVYADHAKADGFRRFLRDHNLEVSDD